MFFIICGALISASVFGENMVYKSDFNLKADDWQKQGQADLSSVSRTPGGKSIKIWRNNEDDDKIETWWVSPLIKTEGKGAIVSFWAADNYLVQPDFSYSAAVGIEECDEHGTQIGTPTDIYMEWDNAQPTPFLWGKRFSETLKWKYYTVTVPEDIKQFKLKFTWPKQLVRGTCYLTDILVTSVEGKAEIGTSNPASSEASRYKLLLSSPAPGNLFYKEDELRFDALIYSTNPKLLSLPQGAVIEYQIRDFEKSSIVKASLPLTPFSPVKDKSFYSSDAAKKRKITPDNNLVKRIEVKEEAAREAGREFFISASLVLKGEVLAEDTVSYGIVEHFDCNGLDPSRSHFYTWPQGPNFYDSTSQVKRDVTEQDVFRKVRSVRTCMFSYDWRKDQPEFPGPINVTKRLPGFPRTTYLPNIEQVPIEKFVPKGAEKEKQGIDRHGRSLIDYSVDAYVKYINEYIQTNAKGIDWVVPSGLERVISKRAAELQKKAYGEIKKNFPQIRVGCTIYGDGFENFKKYELYDCCDYINFHLYNSQFDWEGLKKLKIFFNETLKRPCPPFTSTECARISDFSQLNQSASMLTGIWELMENGFIAINYYSPQDSHPLDNPDLENELEGDPLTRGYRLVQLVDRPVMAPEVVMAPGDERFRWDDKDVKGAGLSVMPTLRTMAYYNLVKDFDWTEFRKSLELGKSKVYIFDANNSTRCGLETRLGFPPETLLVGSEVPYILKDLFGRTIRITPIDGKSVIQLPPHPVTLIFDGKVPSLDFQICSGGMGVLRTHSGGTLELKLDVPCFYMEGSAEAQMEVRGPNIIRNSWKMEQKNKRLTVSEKIQIPDNSEVGQFQTNVLLKNGNAIFGVLSNSLTISHPLNFVLNPCAPSDDSPSEISLDLENLSDKELAGKVIINNKHLTKEIRPINSEKSFLLGPKRKERIWFDMARELMTPNFNEKIDVNLELSNGEKISRQAELFFRSCPYADKVIKIDGDLSDWPLDKLRPVKMERTKMKSPNIPSPDDAKSTHRFYTMWRENVLYMALVVTDKTPQNRSMNVNLWMDDNVMMGIYPWRHTTGDVLKKGYYREHVGMMKDGNTGKFRMENVEGGPKNMDDVQVAIKRTGDGYIYEFAYSAKALFPIKIIGNNGFRLSLTVFDADGIEDIPGHFNGELSFFGGANINWTANPKLWYEFIFTK
jgi:hypothetical protein